MKIEELKEGQKILVECEFDSLAGANQAWVLIQGEGELVQLDNIKPYQPKPVVPQFLADWYENNKDRLEEAICSLVWLIGRFGSVTDIEHWFTKTENAIQTLINMHQFGYTVEKGKLYTVEIPNPHAKGHNKIYLCKDGNTGKVYLCKGNFNPKKNKNLRLTEAEIRKDFDWAWQWKKEVAE